VPRLRFPVEITPILGDSPSRCVNTPRRFLRSRSRAHTVAPTERPYPLSGKLAPSLAPPPFTICHGPTHTPRLTGRCYPRKSHTPKRFPGRVVVVIAASAPSSVCKVGVGRLQQRPRIASASPDVTVSRCRVPPRHTAGDVQHPPPDPPGPALTYAAASRGSRDTSCSRRALPRDGAGQRRADTSHQHPVHKPG